MTSSTAVPVTVTGVTVPPRVNVALAASGATALASSTHSSGYAVGGVINGDRRGTSWGSGGGWTDGTSDAWPDWIEVRFAGLKTIDEVAVVSVQDAYAAPSEPTATLAFTQYGITAFQVQYWDGAQWLPVSGGSVSGNTLVWRRVTFAPLSTSRVRVWITGALASWSRVTEVEAYEVSGGGGNVAPTVTLTSPAPGASFAAPATVALAATAEDSDGTVAQVAFYASGTWLHTDTTNPYSYTWTNVAAGDYTLTAEAIDNLGAMTSSTAVPVTVTGVTVPPRVNVALAASGATALASSTHSSGYAVGGVINGDRRGTSWGSGGGWTDGTSDAWPDWIEVRFAGLKTIDEVAVVSVQDAYAAPSDPTATLAFTQYGITAFQVQDLGRGAVAAGVGRQCERQHAGVAAGDVRAAQHVARARLDHRRAGELEPGHRGRSVPR